MRGGPWILAALALASGAALVVDASCKSYGSGGGDGGMNPAGPPIVIGASVGETGTLSGQARALKGGLMTAELQINAIGGILGREVQFDIHDDGSSPMLAPGVVKTLLSAGSVAVVGPGASSEVQAVYSLIRMAGKVEISATATAIALTSGYPAGQGWFFRTVPSDKEQGKAVSQFAMQGPKGGDAAARACPDMAIVYNMDAYGMGMDQIIEPYFHDSLGGTIVYSAGVPENATGDYSSEANAIVAKRPECMAMVVFSPVGDQLVQAVTTAIAADKSGHDWSKFFIIGTDGCYDPSFITNGRASPSNPMSPSWVQGVYGTTADTNPPMRPEYNEFVSLYQTEVGYVSGMTAPDPYTSSEYDAAILLALAIQAAGTTDGKSVRDAMFDVSHGKNPKTAMTYGPTDVPDAIQALERGEDINYNGAAGDEDFDPQGDVVGDFIVWQVQGTNFVTHDYIPASAL